MTVRASTLRLALVASALVAATTGCVSGNKIRADSEVIQADIERGAPVGPGGKVNLVHYGAWLCREMQKK
jgi:hypothetical protein